MLLSLIGCLGLMQAAAPPQSAPPSALPSTTFVENRGQWDPEVRFAALRSSAALCVGRGAFWTVGADAAGRSDLLLFRLRDAGALEPRGEEPQAGRTNFLLGADRNGWRTGVPGYARVRFAGVAPGIDLVLREHDGVLHYDLELAAAADLAAFGCTVEGGTLALTGDGGLSIATALGALVQPPPITWERLPDGQRRPLRARFVLRSTGEFGIAVEGRHPARATVVDPALIWATYLGGSDVDRIEAVERLGDDVFVVGTTKSTNFPTSATAYDRTYSGTYRADPTDIFVARLRTTGAGAAQLVYSTYVGERIYLERPYDLFVDSGGNATVAGTAPRGIPTSSFAFQPNPLGNGEGFVFQLSPSGSAVNWGTYVGGSSFDEVRGVHVDPANDRVTVVGRTYSADLPTTFLAYDRSHNGMYDAFVLRLDGAGSTLRYSTFLGGAYDDEANAVDVLADGTAVLGGATRSPTFPTTRGAFQTTLRPASQAGFVTKVANDGRSLVASTFFDSLSDLGTGIEVLALDTETSGHVWIGGRTRSPYFPFMTIYCFDITYQGESEGFVSRLEPMLDRLTVSSYCGGLGADEVRGLHWDGADSAVVGGWTASIDFPTTPQCFDGTHNGSNDGFALRVSNQGRLLYSTLYGGSGDDRVTGVAIGPDGSAVLGGWTISGDLPLAHPYDSTPNGTEDGFAAILDMRRARTWPVGYEYTSGDTTLSAPLSAPPNDASRLTTVMKRSGIPWSAGSSITALSLRGVLPIGTRATNGALRMRIGTTPRLPEQISLRFDANFAATPQTVFQGNLDLPGYAVRPTVRIPFATPYLDGGTGNLALDLFFAADPRLREGTIWPIGAVSQDHGARAGTVRTYGAGCPGSNGRVPQSAAILVTAVPGAELMLTTEGSVRPTSTQEQVAVNIIGLSTTSWAGTPLPLSLGFLGANPACMLRTDLLSTANVPVLAATATTSRAYAAWQLPPTPSWNGQSLHSQWLFWDLRVGTALPWIVSDAATVTFGTMATSLMGGQSVWKVGGADGSTTEVGTRDLGSRRPILDFEGGWK
jgi:hypothetical protein